MLDKLRSLITVLLLLAVLMRHSEGASEEETEDIIIELPSLGKIQGKVVETAWTQREVVQFVDVRYAESPSGKHRFKVSIGFLKTTKRESEIIVYLPLGPSSCGTLGGCYGCHSCKNWLPLHCGIGIVTQIG